MSRIYDTEIDFYIGGKKVGGTCLSVTDGKIDTQAAEDEFYAVLRKNEKKIIEEAEEHQREYIIDHLTSAEEDKLKEVHMAQYRGTDDDAPDDFDAWVVELPLDELKTILK